MESAVLGVRLLLAATFAVAGVAKLMDLDGSRGALRGFGVAERAAKPLGIFVPVAELLVAGALIVQPTAQWGAVGALVLLLTFSAGIANALRQGERPDCHCFGQIHSAPAGRETLLRNLGLAVLAGFVAVQGPGPTVDDWVAARSPAELVAIALGAATAVLGVVALRLSADKAKLTERLTETRSRLDKVPVGLPPGTPAPDFVLPTVHGAERALPDLRSKGVPMLLVFVDPFCGPCTQLVPGLTAWQRQFADRLGIVMIGIGAAEPNAEVARRNDAELLLDESSTVFDSYRLRDTPSAVLIDGDKLIASQPLNTPLQVEAMVRLVLRSGDYGDDATSADAGERVPASG